MTGQGPGRYVLTEIYIKQIQLQGSGMAAVAMSTHVGEVGVAGDGACCASGVRPGAQRDNQPDQNVQHARMV